MPLTDQDLRRIETELTVLMYTAEGTLRYRDDEPSNPVSVQAMSIELN